MNKTSTSVLTNLPGDQAAADMVGVWSSEHIEERLSFKIATYQQWGVQYWPLFLKETHEHIGCCGFHTRNQPNGVWEAGMPFETRVLVKESRARGSDRRHRLWLPRT